MRSLACVFAGVFAVGCGSGHIDIDLVHAAFQDPYRGLDTLRVSIVDPSGNVRSHQNLDPFAPDLRLAEVGAGTTDSIRVEGLTGDMVVARGESAVLRLADGANAVPVPFSTLDVAVALPAPAITTSLKIDGRLDDWANAPVAAVLGPNTVSYGQVKNDADLSAKVFLAWRDDALYLAMHVLDNCVVCDPNHPDKVIVSYDGHGDRESGTYGADDGNITVGPTLQDLPTGVEAGTSNVPGGYAIEIRIPWTTLGIMPPTGPVRIGLEIELFDGSDGAYQKVEAWVPSPDPLNRRPFPDEFGSLGVVLWP